MSTVDDAGEVRKDEELDAAKVDAWLRSQGIEAEGLPLIRQFPGGASNLTYLLHYPAQDFILRRPPFGHKAKGAHDMKRESSIMQALKPVYPHVPKVYAWSDGTGVMDSEFYVMECIKGMIPRKDLPKDMPMSPEDARKLCLSVIDRLIELHQVDYKAAGLESLGKGSGYTQRQISGWAERFRKARTPDVNDYEKVIAWLEAKMPAQDVATCVIHNDYRFDNVVLDADNPFNVICVLDWEMATLGDPLMDLGNTLAYWVQADDDEGMQAMRRQPTNIPGMLTRQEVIDYYGKKTGWSVENFDFYTVYGLFRFGVILQQIWYRYYHGQTKNPWFATFGKMVNYLESRCLRLIAESTL